MQLALGQRVDDVLDGGGGDGDVTEGAPLNDQCPAKRPVAADIGSPREIARPARHAPRAAAGFCEGAATGGWPSSQKALRSGQISLDNGS